jgi:hypothetical protein
MCRMVLSRPFEIWLAAGCPPEWDFDGIPVDRDWTIGIEFESISDDGPTALNDTQCAQAGVPKGSSNIDAIEAIRKRWPLEGPGDAAGALRERWPSNPDPPR